MTSLLRPAQVTLFASLLFASSLCMSFIGMAANAYYAAAACLLLQALLLWRGKAFRLFEGIMLINQISGLVLILVLWLGDGLGELKLNISGVMLLINLLSGGPLMSLLSIAILGSLRLDKSLSQWFQSHAA